MINVSDALGELTQCHHRFLGSLFEIGRCARAMHGATNHSLRFVTSGDDKCPLDHALSAPWNVLMSHSTSETPKALSVPAERSTAKV